MEDHLSWPLNRASTVACGSCFGRHGSSNLRFRLWSPEFDFKDAKPHSETFKCFRTFWKVPNFHIFIMFLMSLWLILIGCSIPLVGFLPKKGKAIRRTFPILALGPSQEHKPLNLICSSPSKSFTTLDPKQYSAIFRLQNITSGYLGHHHCQAAKQTFTNFTYQVSLAFWILSIRILRSDLEFGLLEKKIHWGKPWCRHMDFLVYISHTSGKVYGIIWDTWETTSKRM